MHIQLKLQDTKDTLSCDVPSGSEITPYNKIDKPQVVYRFTDEVHNNNAYIMTQL